ncbi:MAG TPA: hypothetical protein VF980_08565 [Thermoanaerobaculia bacterium]
MSTVTGIFPSVGEAENAMRALEAHGFEHRQLNLLARGETSFPVHAKQAGAALGGYLGLSAATLIPGLGPVLGMGMLASGLIGVALGTAAGAAVGRHTHGIPNEDLYFYEEALRDGRAVVLVDARDATQETQARNLIERAGGRPVGATRREWWQAVRQGEREHLHSLGRRLEPIEEGYRSGFEAALHPTTRGREYDQVVDYVETCYPGPCRSDEFRAGYERGQDYFRRRNAGRETE